ncbi:MAG: RsiV family protein [Christensenellales bacterium]|jgi:hypothetical protein
MKNKVRWIIGGTAALFLLLLGLGLFIKSSETPFDFETVEHPEALVYLETEAWEDEFGAVSLQRPITRSAQVNNDVWKHLQAQAQHERRGWRKTEPQTAGRWMQITIRPSFINENLVSFLFCKAVYEGGAHPQETYYTISYDLATGKSWNLRRLFRDESAAPQRLMVAAKQAMMQTGMDLVLDKGMIGEVIQPDMKSFRAYAWDGDILQIIYDPGALAPYAEGEIVVPIRLYSIADALADDVHLPVKSFTVDTLEKFESE